MDARPIIPVILSGGSGSRLWPLSTSARPKQLLALTSDQTLLQLTAIRVLGDKYAAPVVVANAAHADEVENQLRKCGAEPQSLILEPFGRNTAPAIALAALAAPAPSDFLLVMPSDHVIADVPAFHAAILRAMPNVAQGCLVTFGITPVAPQTGYGWIQVGDLIGPGVHSVERFVEKPARGLAEAMLATGGYVWNGGIFLFRADVYLAALARFAPDILVAVEHSMSIARRDGRRIYPDRDAFAASPADLIDYAIMEKADRAAVVPVAMGWDDVGSWDALYAISELDGNGNALTGEVTAVEARDCFVRSDGMRVALFGVSDLVVVASGKDILIVPRTRSQAVTRLIEAMKSGVGHSERHQVN